jgi:hypothetical protein
MSQTEHFDLHPIWLALARAGIPNGERWTEWNAIARIWGVEYALEKLDCEMKEIELLFEDRTGKQQRMLAAVRGAGKQIEKNQEAA